MLAVVLGAATNAVDTAAARRAACARYVVLRDLVACSRSAAHCMGCVLDYLVAVNLVDLL